jgi:hypothetical protein
MRGNNNGNIYLVFISHLEKFLILKYILISYNYIFKMSFNETIIVTAKRIPGITDLILKDGQVISYSGMLFNIWNEIAKANNYELLSKFLPAYILRTDDFFLL